MIRNKESRTKVKLVSQIRWEKREGNCQAAAVLAQKVGRHSTEGVRRCIVTLQINHTDNNKGWIWSTAVLGLKTHKAGEEDSIEAAKEAAIAALPDIWSDLRDFTVKDLRHGEDVHPKEPSWN